MNSGLLIQGLLVYDIIILSSVIFSLYTIFMQHLMLVPSEDHI